MIAIVELDGKQHTVSVGDVIDVDNQNLADGETLTAQALLVSSPDGSDTKVGTPFVEGSKISFEVLSTFKDEKVTVFKMKSKKRYSRTRGFRAVKTQLKVLSIA
jgi:large subunit ribosomal protein L21